MSDKLLCIALDALRSGKTLLYPTDTLWGIGCDATCVAAVERLYAIKQRDHAKSMLVLASSMMRKDLPVAVVNLLERSERPTTVVMPCEWLAVPVAYNRRASDGTIGVRIPRMDFCQRLLAALQHPIVSTSANFSGQPSPACYEDISPNLKASVDCCLPDSPAFLSGNNQGSRIVKYSPDGMVTILRP